MNSRRNFLKWSLATAGVSTLAESFANSNRPVVYSEKTKTNTPANPIRFSVIGLNHGHIYGQVSSLLKGGGQLVSYFAKEQSLVDEFSKRYPDAKHAKSEEEILEDNSIQLIASASIPIDRAPLGIRVMKNGKDFMVDKPGVVSLDQLTEVRKVQKETRRIYSIMYGERLENKATVKAVELVNAGAIGKVIQTIGLGPHRMNPKSRPEWFFEKEKFGGILCDIAAHQFDQFLVFTNSTQAEVLSSQTGNVHFPQYPHFEDFGDAQLRGNNGTGYLRVDWFTPDGLSTWGDTRLTILGTDGYIEIRKNIDLAGRTGGDHLFLVDQKGTKYIDCQNVDLPYGTQLVNDIVNRTDTAMSQDHCFFATELALKSQQQAKRLELKK